MWGLILLDHGPLCTPSMLRALTWVTVARTDKNSAAKKTVSVVRGPVSRLSKWARRTRVSRVEFSQKSFSNVTVRMCTVTYVFENRRLRRERNESLGFFFCPQTQRDTQCASRCDDLSLLLYPPHLYFSPESKPSLLRSHLAEGTET